MDLIYWDHYYNAVLLVNLLIVIGFFTFMRLFSGAIAHVDANDELLRKDNPAFGISLGAATLGLTIVLTGTVYGAPDANLVDAVFSVLIFGLIGVLLLVVTRMIFGKITLPSVSLRGEIIGGNKAVAIADAGNILAAAIVIRSVMVWVPEVSVEGLLTILGGYAISQAILTVTSIVNIKQHKDFHDGFDFQKELREGNAAMALRFSGKKIGTAFAIATAAQIVVYEELDVVGLLTAWALASVFVLVIWEALCFLATRIILFRVKLDDEVLRQRNIALGFLQGAIFLALGMLVWSL